MYICDICNMGISTFFNLRIHKVRKHKQNIIKDVIEKDLVAAATAAHNKQLAAAAAAAAPGHTNRQQTNIYKKYDHTSEESHLDPAAAAAAPSMPLAAAAPDEQPAAAAAATLHQSSNMELSSEVPEIKPELPCKELQISTSPVTLSHSFCLNLCGPSHSGKTYLVKKILQEEKISPNPDRIVYLYKRWQPLYTEMQQTIPNIEFIQGIPLNLDDDKFFDTNKNNLIILDDMMSSAANDPQITDLFTEGSHHRSLSVINITQNLFPTGKHAATQRRNTQYMIIFKSPMSEDQVQTLGRFMYPGKVPQFMKIYHEATKRPYGYLMIDAKHTTPEHERFKTELFNHNEAPRNTESIKGEKASLPRHLISDRQGEHTSLDKFNGLKSKLIKGEQQALDTELQRISNTLEYSVHPISESEEMAACDFCGIMFENTHDLQRHVKNWCPEGEPLAKKPRLVNELPEETKFSTDAEMPVFKSFMEKSRKHNEAEWLKKVDKYTDQGMVQDEAEEKANIKFKALDMALFLKAYVALIRNMLQLSRGVTHNQIMEAIDDLKKRGYSERDAVPMAVKQLQNHIESLLDNTESDQSDDSESESDESEESDDDSSDDHGSDDEGNAVDDDSDEE